VVDLDLVLAGGNPAKAAALKRVASILGVRCGRRVRVEVDESGPTFADNARVKAIAASQSFARALALASDGGLEIPSLGARWDPLHTSRFAPGAEPADKAQRLLDLLAESKGEARVARWTEALAIARDGRALASWTVAGPRRIVAASVPRKVGPFWVDSILQLDEQGPSHWELLAARFAEYCRREGYAR
jgi:inosine/xanthosine triphosphate pyrophosphatase family protein